MTRSHTTLFRLVSTTYENPCWFWLAEIRFLQFETHSSRQQNRAICFSAFFLALTVTSPLYAIHPSTSYIFPAGVQRGTTVQVRVGGLYLHNGCNFRMPGSGIKASERIVSTETIRFPKKVVPQTYFPQEHSFPRDYSGTIEVTPDAPLGIRYWQVWTSQGGTSPRRFIIGDLPEVVEHEIDGNAVPQVVRLPVTVNGRIYPREDIDIWSFKAKAGQEISCEVNASRLGSTLDSFLEVRDGNERRIAENTDHFGSDSFLRFIAPKDDTYHVHIHDVRLGGLQSSVYRLTITDGPYVDTTYPLGGRRGDRIKLELLGQAVPAQAMQLRLPADGRSDYIHELDVAGTKQMVHLDLNNFVEALETEPNNNPSQVAKLQAPLVVNGRIGEAGDVDCWRLKAKKGETFQFEFRARRHGTLLNPLLVISDDAGKELLRMEDRSQFSFPNEGTYCLTIKERFNPRGGPNFIYRMQISPPLKPDYRLQPAQQALTLIRGASAELTVNAKRLGGFGGEIILAMDDLPEGVTAANASIPAGKNTIKIKLEAGPKARVSATRVRIRGTADIDGQPLTRTATYQLDPSEPETETILLTIALTAPFKFKGDYEAPFVLRGTTHYRRYHLDRGGFQGQLYARLCDSQLRHQWGTTGTAISLPSDVTEFNFPLQISTWTKVGLTGRTVIMLVGEVEDFDGTKHTVAYTSNIAADQIMIQPNAGPLSIAAIRTSVIASPEKPAQIPVIVRRDPELPLPVTLTLVMGKHMRGIEAAPVEIPAGENRGTLQIQFTADAGPFNMPLVIRATVQPAQTMIVRSRPLRKADPIIAEARVSVVVPK